VPNQTVHVVLEKEKRNIPTKFYNLAYYF